ncbi:MAG: PH domain-containing protein, partial [Microcella sp.]|nr:PH domain-containing protein [Microcella sp.]
MRFQPASFRPAFGRVLTIAVAVVSVLGLIGLVVGGDFESLLRYGAWFVLLVAVTVALYWVPSVEVLEHEVVVRNPLSTWHVPWPDIERIDTKWALTLYTRTIRIEAWAAPSSGRFTVFTLGPDDTKVS